MKRSEKAALAYTLAVIGAGALAYYRGRNPAQVLGDAVLHGAVAGTGITVVWWLADQGTEARANATTEGAGRLGEKAVQLLTVVADHVEKNGLYSDLKKDGVKIAPVPDNPGIVLQDAD